MAEDDLKKFLGKVSQLQKMVDSLEQFPGRRELLADCKDHDQVVQLARKWGFERCYRTASGQEVCIPAAFEALPETQ